VTTVLRALCVYAVLLILFRIAGKRTLAQITTFDLVLTLIISEAIQQALVDNDNSLTSAFILVITLVSLDIGLSFLTNRSPRLDRLLEGLPVVVLERGTPVPEHMQREGVTRNEILEAARESHGLERIEQVKYAVVEPNGQITIVPARPS
jgi:uncharacterized membrane protein YcaP (DUF421 family)